MLTDGKNGLVNLQFEDLCNSDCSVRARLLRSLEQAYGPEGLGILTVAGVPSFLELRREVLPLTAEFVALPENVRESYADPASSYSFGWSHGKEALEDGVFDTLKGSFYANPMQDNIHMEDRLQQQYPSYCRPNIWPEKHLPQLQPRFQALGQLMAAVGEHLAALCDDYMRQKGVQPCSGSLQQIMEKGRPCYKARLLHYFADPECASKGSETQAPWCGWHTDHSSLTGLASAMYIKDRQEVPNPDSTSGLYIRRQDGTTVQVKVPADHIAFQMGEAMQIHSGGLLRATMHCVKGAAGPAAAEVTRHSFALFMQPRWDQPMDLPPGTASSQMGVGQWQPGLDFGQFSELTVQHYYRNGKQA
ncbi:g11861 [Coccomyxa viridis]|uniref:G11861 protein n=1 Tax=Coccomyxa viridis TaxID=1274662 RepID=A0ABP1GD41_9CHLO